MNYLSIQLVILRNDSSPQKEFKIFGSKIQDENLLPIFTEQIGSHGKIRLELLQGFLLQIVQKMSITKKCEKHLRIYVSLIQEAAANFKLS